MGKRRLKVLAIVMYPQLLLLAAYFKYFPTILNSQITNFCFIVLLSVFICCLVYGTLCVEEPQDIYFLLPQTALFIFISYMIPNLRLSYQPLHDSWYHYVAASNIIDYGTLSPIVASWYSNVDQILHFPMMHLLTTALYLASNIDLMQLFRFQEAIVGTILFLVVFLLAKNLIKNDGIALLASVFACSAAEVVFRFGEYQTQGFGIAVFTLFMYVYLRYKASLTATRTVAFTILLILIAIEATLSHKMVSWLLGILAILLLLTLAVIRNMPKVKETFDNFNSGRGNEYLILLIMGFIVIFYQLIIWPDFTRQSLYAYTHLLPEAAPFTTTMSQKEPSLTILQLLKYPLFVLAAVSLIPAFKSKNTTERYAALWVAVIMVAGAVSTVRAFAPIDRIIALYYPLAGIFAAMTIYKFKNVWFPSIKKYQKTVIMLVIIVPLIGGGILGSQTPSYFFHDTSVNTDLWYSDRLPAMDQYRVTSEWVGNYKEPMTHQYGVAFDTLAPLFYFGKIPYWNLWFLYSKSGDVRNVTFDYVVINPSMPSSNKPESFNEKNILPQKLDVIYSNKEVEVYKPAMSKTAP